MASSSLVNKLMSHSLVAAVAITAAMVASSPAKAADFDFSGTFQEDNDVLLFNFNVGADSTIVGASRLSCEWEKRLQAS